MVKKNVKVNIVLYGTETTSLSIYDLKSGKKHKHIHKIINYRGVDGPEEK